MVQQSLPPSWVYNHVESNVKMNITLNASRKIKPGNYSFMVTAEPSMEINAPKTSQEFKVTVVNGKIE